MVILFSYANPLLLLFSTTLVVIHGYRRNPLDGETDVLEYRLEGDSDFQSKRDPGKNLMWIGPRLGRRKRSEDENIVGNVVLPEKNGRTVLEFLQDSPWAFVAVKGGKRRTVNFIPRLGRDSEEEYDNSVDSSFSKSSSRSGNQLAGTFGSGNNFTPRLGRNVMQVSCYIMGNVTSTSSANVMAVIDVNDIKFSRLSQKREIYAGEDSKGKISPFDYELNFKGCYSHNAIPISFDLSNKSLFIAMYAIMSKGR